MSTSAGAHARPRAVYSAATQSRSAGTPSVGPYWMASGPYRPAPDSTASAAARNRSTGKLGRRQPSRHREDVRTVGELQEITDDGGGGFAAAPGRSSGRAVPRRRWRAGTSRQRSPCTWSSASTGPEGAPGTARGRSGPDRRARRALVSRRYPLVAWSDVSNSPEKAKDHGSSLRSVREGPLLGHERLTRTAVPSGAGTRTSSVSGPSSTARRGACTSAPPASRPARSSSPPGPPRRLSERDGPIPYKVSSRATTRSPGWPADHRQRGCPSTSWPRTRSRLRVPLLRQGQRVVFDLDEDGRARGRASGARPTWARLVTVRPSSSRRPTHLRCLPRAPRSRHDARHHHQRPTEGLGGRVGGRARAGRYPLVRRLREEYDRLAGELVAAPSLPAWTRRSARTATGPTPTPATSPGWRTGRSSAPRRKRRPVRTTTGASRTRCGPSSTRLPGVDEGPHDVRGAVLDGSSAHRSRTSGCSSRTPPTSR